MNNTLNFIVKKKISSINSWINRIKFDWYAGLSLASLNDNENEQILDDSQVDDLVENCQHSTSQAVRETATQKDTKAKTPSQNKENKKKRVKSLDAFRGLSITIMIFVNYGGGGYW